MIITHEGLYLRMKIKKYAELIRNKLLELLDKKANRITSSLDGWTQYKKEFENTFRELTYLGYGIVFYCT